MRVLYIVAVPLLLEQTGIGYILAGQVFDQYPETFLLELAAQGCGLSQQEVWNIGRTALPISTAHLEVHHGTVEVHSAPGQGSTFKVLFPASDKEPAIVRPPLDIPCQQGAGTILVVDDELIVRNVATVALERSGYTVLSAEDGETAIELLQQDAAGAIVLVLLDMTMPGLNGYGTFLQLKRVRPGIRVLLSSGYNEAEATRQFAGEGLAGFIHKPYPAAALSEKVKTILTNRLK